MKTSWACMLWLHPTEAWAHRQNHLQDLQTAMHLQLNGQNRFQLHKIGQASLMLYWNYQAYSDELNLYHTQHAGCMNQEVHLHLVLPAEKFWKTLFQPAD